MEWARWAISIAAILVGNVIVWAFLWGKYNQRLINVEKAQVNPDILPECQELFRDIKGSIGNLTGKVDVILNTITENQKNEERKRTDRRRRKD